MIETDRGGEILALLSNIQNNQTGESFIISL